jgi:hypothetical protein
MVPMGASAGCMDGGLTTAEATLPHHVSGVDAESAGIPQQAPSGADCVGREAAVWAASSGVEAPRGDARGTTTKVSANASSRRSTYGRRGRAM